MIAQYDKKIDKIKKEEIVLDNLKSKYNQLASSNKAPASLTAMETLLKKNEKEINNLENQYNSVIEDLGKKQVDLEWAKSSGDTNQISKIYLEQDNLNAKSIDIATKLEDARDEAERLKKEIETLKLNPMASMEAQNLKAKIAEAEREISKTKNESSQLGQEIVKTNKFNFDNIKDSAENTWNGIAKYFNGKDGIKNGIESISNKITKLSKKITRLALTAMVFRLLRQSLTQLSNSFISLLKSNDDFSSSLNQIKANLMTAFAPIYNAVLPAINALMDALSRVTGTIATFVSSLFGQTASQAKKNAKELYNQAEATKAVGEAQEGLASFDKLEVNNDNKSGGSNSKDNIDFGGNIEVNNELLDFFNKIKEIVTSFDFNNLSNSFSNFCNSLKGFGSGLGQTLIDFFNNFLLPLANWTISDALPRFFNSTADAINKIDWTTIQNSLNNLWDALLPFSINIGEGLLWFYENVLLPLGTWTMNELLLAFFNILSGSLSIINQAITDLQPIWQWFWDNVLAPIIDWTGGVIVEVLNGIGDALNWISQNEIAMTLLESLAIAIGLVAAAIGIYTGALGIYNGVMAACNAVTGIFSGIMAVLNNPITLVVVAITALIAIITLLIKHWDEVSSAASACWEWIKGVWNTVATWFNDNIIKPIGDFFTGMWEGLKNGAKNAWDGVKQTFNSVASFFGDIFGKAWDGVKKVFSTGGKVFDGIKEGIVNAFKAVVNALITGINKVVALPFNGLNGILNTIHNIDILGVRPFNWLTWRAPVPQLPYLATGAVIPPNAKFAAVLGDQKHGKNLEAPESLIRKIVREESGDKEVILNATFIMQCETEEIGRASLKGIRLLENLEGEPYFVR